MPKPNPLDRDGGEELLGRQAAGSGKPRQARTRFGGKPGRKRLALITQICRHPPVGEPLRRRTERRCRWQQPALRVPVDPAVSGNDVPEISAGPGGPRQAVVKVQVACLQSAAASDAQDALSSCEHPGGD